MRQHSWNSDYPLTGNLELAAALHSLHEILTDDLPLVATKALEEGLDSPSLRMLAGTTTSSGFEIDELLTRTLSELGLRPMNPQRAQRVLARFRARQIVDGKVDPVVGAENVYRTYLPEYPDETIEFLRLSDEASYDPQNRREVELKIIEEARRYLHDYP